jgi:hypothetical protein
MGIDIKFPIGLLFAIFGQLLTIYGLITRNNVLLYKRSLGVNINLWCGLGMLVFGLIMLLLTYRSYRIKKKQASNLKP